jgi:uncharacterized protein (TIGR03790 family)
MTRLVALALAAIPACAYTGQNVLVVVNASSTASRQIGEYYVRKRSVPLANVCTIRTATSENVSWTVYTAGIEQPIRRCIQKTAPGVPIQFLVTTSGVPLRVTGPGSGWDTETAAVDSELTLLYMKMRGASFARKGVVPNPFFGQRQKRFDQGAFPMYLVARLAAYDVHTVLRMIDRSLAAKNTGKVYLDAKSDEAGSGDGWLRDAAVRLPDGRAVYDDTSRVLYGQKDVIGYGSWGSNDSGRKRRTLGFEWLPGAIVNEYVSTNGRTFERPPANWKLGSWKDRDSWFAGAPQSLSADYLDEGATGASGHVAEPFLVNCPRPDLLFPAYLAGRTLAESYYVAMRSLSWQNIVLGDPLCRLQ